MNKAELTELVAQELGQSKAAATRAIDAVLHGLEQGIERDGAVTLTGFGSFSRKERAARMGRNPMTREPMEIKASTTVGFRASQQLKERLSAGVAATA